MWTSLALATAVLTGCSVNKIVPTTSSPGPAVAAQSLKGLLHGGQQALVGAQVYLYKMGTGGYQSASSSLLASPAITGSDGHFAIASGSFTCNAGDQLYLYSVGGSPGSSNSNNPYAGLLAVLGDCANLGNLPSTIQMNEETTVAAAWALAPFAGDATHISTGSSTQAKLGLDNAVATALNLVPLQSGQAPAKLPSNGNATLPQDEINTLADILAACVNVSDSTYGSPNHNSSACSTLASDATADGTPGGTQPSDTATAAINIAHNPTVHVADLLTLATPTSPFQNILSSANDWTIAINYSGGSLHGPLGLAIDSAGYIWVANSGAFCISQFQPNGAPGPEDGFTGNGVDPTNCGTGENGTFAQPYYIAFAPSGNIWLANYNSATELDFAPGLGFESTLSYTGNYTSGNVNSSTGIAFDASGHAWIPNGGYGANSVTEFVGSSGTSYGGGGLNGSSGIAIDASGHAWITNANANVLSEFNVSNGTPVSSTGYQFCGVQLGRAVAVAQNGIWVANGGGVNTLTECTSSGSSNASASGSGLSYPTDIAIDGLGNVWVANSYNSTVSEFNSGGGALSGSNGFKAGLNGPEQLAIDPSGNVWVTDYNNGAGNGLTEFVGAAAPVVTPVVQAVSNNQLGQRP
ncbi:MAG: NHL repeat-containing protein [Acidobacteriota bacterium]